MTRYRFGLPWWAILLLAALSLPRVVVHDLDVDTGAWGPALLAIGPMLVWVGVALWARVPSPVTTLLVVGTVYGIGLGIGHNLMWDSVFAEDPRLGGSWEGRLPRQAEEVIMRIVTLGSSVVTGAVVGLVSGLVATGLRRLGRSARSRR